MFGLTFLGVLLRQDFQSLWYAILHEIEVSHSPSDNIPLWNTSSERRAVLVRVLVGNRWHTQTGEFEERLIISLWVRSGRGKLSVPGMKSFDRGIQGLPIHWKVGEAAPEYLRLKHHRERLSRVPREAAASVSTSATSMRISLPCLLPSKSFFCFSLPAPTQNRAGEGF